MIITGINSVPVEPFPVANTDRGSVAIAQTSNTDTKAALSQRPLQKETRSTDEIHKDIEVINNQLKAMNRTIEFSIDSSSKDIVIRVMDKESGELITQIPSEGILRLREHIDEMIGLIVEKKV